MRVKTWIIVDRGNVPEDALTIPYECECGHEAELPVKGRPMAITGGGGVVFDTDQKGELPRVIQCRKCRRILTMDYADVR